MLLDVLGDDVKSAKVIIEQENSFRNANTTRNILHRVGYIKNSLEKLGAVTHMANAMAARKFLGAKNKADVTAMFKPFGLTADEADAMAILCHQQAISFELLTPEQFVLLRGEE